MQFRRKRRFDTTLLNRAAVVLMLTTLAIRGVSRAAGEASLPPVPPNFVLDEARAMSDDSKAALADELRRFRETTGCSLFVVTTTFLSGKTVRDHATALLDAWVPSGQGIVFAYDRASDAHALSPTRTMWETYPTPSLVEAFREGGTLVQEKGVSLDERLVGCSRLLMDRLAEAEQQRKLHNQLLPGYDLWAALVFCLILIAGALVCGLIIAKLRKRDAASAIRYFFPQADVALRFGAPYGGGVIAEAQVNQRHP